MRRISSWLIRKYEQKTLTTSPFCLISNNCWGYDAYRVLGRAYNTPFVGLFLYPDCYLTLLENFETLIDNELIFAEKSKYNNGDKKSYPIGVLADTEIEIHFVHYSSNEDARGKWFRRKGRLRAAMDKQVPLFYKFCDRDGCKAHHLERFHNLDFEKKVSFTARPYDYSENLYTPSLEESNQAFVIDGRKMFLARYRCFDFSYWIRTGHLERTIPSRILGAIQEL